MNRELVHIHNSQPATDGDGVKINRSVATKSLGTFDPFLLLDEIFSDNPDDYIGGFPEHPHRGFETVTYMLEGSMKHRDHMGNEGMLEPGSVQWMTAGRGVLHSEMPMQKEGRLHGFQLWINLPANEKMQPADYQEFSKQQVPVVHLGERSQVKVIAGKFNDNGNEVCGPVTGVTTQPDYFDFDLEQGETVRFSVASNKRILLYVFQGAVSIGDKTLKEKQLGMLSQGESVEFHALENTRMLFLAGEPLNEPIANWGPFVMNHREEIEQAIADYKNGTLV